VFNAIVMRYRGIDAFRQNDIMISLWNVHYFPLLISSYTDKKFQQFSSNAIISLNAGIRSCRWWRYTIYASTFLELISRSLTTIVISHFAATHFDAYFATAWWCRPSFEHLLIYYISENISLAFRPPRAGR
jgi:hypothetical protein